MSVNKDIEPTSLDIWPVRVNFSGKVVETFADSLSRIIGIPQPTLVRTLDQVGDLTADVINRSRGSNEIPSQYQDLDPINGDEKAMAGVYFVQELLEPLGGDSNILNFVFQVERKADERGLIFTPLNMDKQRFGTYHNRQGWLRLLTQAVAAGPSDKDPLFIQRIEWRPTEVEVGGKVIRAQEKVLASGGTPSPEWEAEGRPVHVSKTDHVQIQNFLLAQPDLGSRAEELAKRFRTWLTRN